MFPNLDFIKTMLNGLRSRIEKVEKSISQALASVKAQLADIIQDIKNTRIESAEAIKSSTADWGQNDSNALDYVKNRTHYVLPATPIGSLDFTATAFDTISYTMTEDEAEFAIFSYFQSLRNKGEVLKIIVGGKEGLLAVAFDRGNFGFSGVFTGSVYWRAGNVLSLVAQNDFITFNQGDTYTASFEDTTTPYYSKLDFNYMPDNVYHSENAPVKFGSGENSAVQGNGTTATGSNAHAEGIESAATGSNAHAEGSGSTASGTNAHAEGIHTVASGYGSHAEGNNPVASGYGSHAEGNYTEASGYASHAEGDYTVANRRGMHAEGKYNLYDSAKYIDVVSSSIEFSWRNRYAASEYTFDANTGYYTLVNAEPKNEAVIGLYYAYSFQYENGTIDELEKPISLIDSNRYQTEKHQRKLAADAQGKYVHVVGNGVSSARSNAYTLDWDGNGWFAGDVFVGGTGQDEGVKLLKAGEAIPIPQTASVGQVLAVKAVDETGKPTEWEAADMGSGGGGETPIGTISEGTLSEDVANIVIDGFSKRTIALSVVPYGSTANSGNIKVSLKFGLDSGDVLTCNPTFQFVTNTASVAWNKIVAFAFMENGIIEVTIYRDGGTLSQDISMNSLASTNTWLAKSVYIGAQKITSVTIGLQADGVIGKNTAYKVVGS